MNKAFIEALVISGPGRPMAKRGRALSFFYISRTRLLCADLSSV